MSKGIAPELMTFSPQKKTFSQGDFGAIGDHLQIVFFVKHMP